MAKLIDQYSDLKQYANTYLSQVDGLVRNLYELKYSLTEVLLDVESRVCHCHSLLDKDYISLGTLKDTIKELPASYSKGFFFLEGIIINLLKEKKILSAHYKICSVALAEMEVIHG
jgi:hypothetical protein